MGMSVYKAFRMFDAVGENYVITVKGDKECHWNLDCLEHFSEDILFDSVDYINLNELHGNITIYVLEEK